MTIERAHAVCHGPHGVHATVRGHKVTTDRPREMGGEDAGLMASEHVLVALASCMCTSARKVAAKRGVTLTRLEAAAEMSFDAKGDVDAIRLEVDAHAPDAERDVRKVLELAKRVCTISKLLAVDVAHVHRIHAESTLSPSE